MPKLVSTEHHRAAQQFDVPGGDMGAGKGDRVGIKLADGGKKVRVFKSSGQEIKA